MQLLQELSIKNGPLCVGLDTDPSYIPENILKQYESPAKAVLAYNKAIIDRVGNLLFAGMRGKTDSGY